LPASSSPKLKGDKGEKEREEELVIGFQTP